MSRGAEFGEPEKPSCKVCRNEGAWEPASLGARPVVIKKKKKKTIVSFINKDSTKENIFRREIRSIVISPIWYFAKW